MTLSIFSNTVLEQLQFNRTHTTGPSNFLEKEQWKRIRTTFQARTVVSSLRSAHAKLIGCCFPVGGNYFWSYFGDRCLGGGNGAKRTPKWLQQFTNICSKTTLETKSTKHAENVLKLMPSDLRKTNLWIERLQQNTNTKGADQCKQTSKKGVKMQPTSVTNGPRNSTKNDDSKQSPKSF